MTIRSLGPRRDNGGAVSRHGKLGPSPDPPGTPKGHEEGPFCHAEWKEDLMTG